MTVPGAAAGVDTATHPPAVPPAAPAPEASKQDRIGDAGAPVRAITFSGGALDTVMQLGVVHALLVARARAPDVVVGVSAGAVNAVALAEVLKAGDGLPDHPEWTALPAPELADRRQQARVKAQIARFRQVLDAYQRAPGDISDALLPDPFQVEAQRPLEPLQLPIHHERERAGRLEALMSRAGMINLYNELLDLRTSIGTLARGVRVLLGFMAAGEIRRRAARIAAILGQILQGWLLLGVNLFRLAPLVPTFVAALLHLAPRAEHGASAGEIIFRWQVVLPLQKVARHALSLLLLIVLWLAASGLVALAPLAIAQALGSISAVPWLGAQRGLVAGLLYVAIALVALVVSHAHPWTGLKRATLYLATLLPFAIQWAAVLVLPILAVQFVAGGFVLASVGRGWGSTLRDSWFGAYVALLALGVLGFAVARLVAARRPSGSSRPPQPFWARLLQRYALDDSLFSGYPLRQLFVRLFDPRYYGGTRINEAVERALNDDLAPAGQDIGGKLLSDYTTPRVGLTVADVAFGGLQLLDPEVRVVDGLLAATAMVPLFPPVAINGALYVDGTNIANEPTRALMNFLRDRLNPDASVVHVYAVAPLPVSQPQLGVARTPHQTGLVDVVQRALQLQRYRDATLERRLTELYTKAIPVDKVLYPAAAQDSAGAPRKQYVRAWVHPIEPDRPLALNKRILEAESNERRRELVAETVADGCRAALQVMIQPAIKQLHDETPRSVEPGPTKPDEGPVVSCRLAVAKHLRGAEPGLPGSGSDSGPGLTEVCSRCAIHRWASDGRQRRIADKVSLRVPVATPPNALVLTPRWPSNDHPELEGEAEFDRAKRQPPRKTGVQPVARWPQDRPAGSGRERPLVNLLFSGGVFRGVYQMGVLNALSEVSVRPDVVAGASVGSITAAMVARALILPDKAQRDRRIARLAATYLALDRLILTDRFADFIRNLTLRAASTRFSLRQADRLFRRYDRPTSGRFGKELRLVVAGLERLFYVSPFELKTLVEAIRDRRSHDVYRLLREYLQEWLDRSGVENEILGAEPLALLITQHVIEGISRVPGMAGFARLEPAQVPFDLFLEPSGVCFLATATNLTQGRLEILGQKQLIPNSPRITLLDGLLASSAFPAVFRPRESWELMPATDTVHQFIDGGVIDNLPLDAVAEFLQQAAVDEWIARRPRLGPHLLFSASLETELTRPTPEQLTALLNNWPALLRRTRQLGYNKKLEVYAATQADLRAIFAISEQEQRPSAWQPLDLEVVMVRPKWLCGTFAFHPMLGFRRANQAASIAHGCASTLARLGELRQAGRTTGWAQAWGIDFAGLPPAGAEPLVPHDYGPNKCWFRPDVDCPFSPGRLGRLELEPRTATELATIYRACGRRETHQTR